MNTEVTLTQERAELLRDSLAGMLQKLFEAGAPDPGDERSPMQRLMEGPARDEFMTLMKLITFAFVQKLLPYMQGGDPMDPSLLGLAGAKVKTPMMSGDFEHARFAFIGTGDAARCQLLLDIAESIGAHQVLPMLFPHLAPLLSQVLPYHMLAVLLNDEATGTTWLHSIESRAPTRLLHDGLEFRTDGTHVQTAFTTQTPVFVHDVDLEPHRPDVLAILHENGLRSYALIPLTTTHRRLGVLGWFSAVPSAYSGVDAAFLQRVASQVALAIDNAQNFAHAERHHREVSEQRDRWRALLEITNALVTTRERDALVRQIATTIRGVVPYDNLLLAVHDEGSSELRVAAFVPEPPPAFREVLDTITHIPLEGSGPGLAFTSRQPVVVSAPDPQRFTSAYTLMMYRLGVKCGCCIPLFTPHRGIGVLLLTANEEDRFSARDVDMLVQVGGQISIAIENAQAFHELSELRDKIAREKIYLEEEIQGEHNFREIVGDSAALGRVLNQLETVAATESTVLVLGETGTGKELVARAIHDRSPRRHRTLVKVNCAAIPSGLLESELFGHEKGAFTGAIERKIGRFELAHQGTLFLDEVGDIPLELQPKLLRVLQEHEFERLGSTRSIKVDVRIVAATNRDLVRMVDDRQFRSDLFYRLNVFPIQLPPLRERREDVPRLVQHFVQKFARRMKRPIESIPSEAMAALCAWSWPGNVRELENVIERAVIQSRGPVLQLRPEEFRGGPEAPARHTVTLEDAEREHILTVLRDTEWVIGGPRGAAARLGMKRTTLNSRMQKLGIARQRQA